MFLSRSGMLGYSCCKGTLIFVYLKRDGMDTQLAFKVHWGMHSCSDPWVSVQTRRRREKSDVWMANRRLHYIQFPLNNIFYFSDGAGSVRGELSLIINFSVWIFSNVFRNLLIDWLIENILELCKCCMNVVVPWRQKYIYIYASVNTVYSMRQDARGRGESRLF